MQLDTIYGSKFEGWKDYKITILNDGTLSESGLEDAVWKKEGDKTTLKEFITSYLKPKLCELI